MCIYIYSCTTCVSLGAPLRRRQLTPSSKKKRKSRDNNSSIKFSRPLRFYSGPLSSHAKKIAIGLELQGVKGFKWLVSRSHHAGDPVEFLTSFPLFFGQFYSWSIEMQRSCQRDPFQKFSVPALQKIMDESGMPAHIWYKNPKNMKWDCSKSSIFPLC